MKKRLVTDTATLSSEKDRRVVLRRYSDKLITVEMDVETLAEVGLPVTVQGQRRRGTWQLDMESGPVWRQR